MTHKVSCDASSEIERWRRVNLFIPYLDSSRKKPQSTATLKNVPFAERLEMRKKHTLDGECRDREREREKERENSLHRLSPSCDQPH